MSLFDLIPELDDETYFSSTDAKFSLIKSLLPKVIREGVSQTEAKRIFRSSGFSFNDARFGRTFNDVKASELAHENLRSLGLESAIRKSELVESSRSLNGKVRFVADFDAYPDAELPSQIRGSFAVDIGENYFTDDEDIIAYSPAQIENLILESLAEKYQINLEDIQQIRLTYGFIDKQQTN